MIDMVLSRNLTGWIDDDRPYLSVLMTDEKIDYFEKRVGLVLIRPIDHLWNDTTEVLGRSDSSALLIVNVSVCCAIEACGRFLKGDNRKFKKWDYFDYFISRYMSPDFKTTLNGWEYSRFLWSYFRNGIAHGFAINHGGFDQKNPNGGYFSVRNSNGRDCLTIDPHQFWAEFKKGFNRYVGDLRSAKAGVPMLDIFLASFKSIFIDGK